MPDDFLALSWFGSVAEIIWPQIRWKLILWNSLCVTLFYYSSLGMVTQYIQDIECDSETIGKKYGQKKWNKVLKAAVPAAEHWVCFVCLSWHCSSEITAGGHQLIRACFISFVVCAGLAVERAEGGMNVMKVEGNGGNSQRCFFHKSVPLLSQAKF